MSGELVELNISKEIITPIIHQKIAQAVLESLGKKPEELAFKMVDAWMNERVGNDGRRSGYDSDNKYRRVDVLVQNMLSEALKEAFLKYVNDNKQYITDAFMRYFKTKEGSSAIVQAMLKGVAEGFSSKWSCNIQFCPPTSR